MKTWEKIHAEILPKLASLKSFIQNERKTKSILPGPGDVFNAYRFTPYENVKIVIIGQDPYPNRLDAHGLAFSSMGKSIPASLENIFKEIHRSMYWNRDIHSLFGSPNLTKWTEQGILLINSVLTVEEGKSGSHAGKGWELFTEHIIKSLNDHPNNIVFMLLGKKAQEFYPLITNRRRHLVLMTSHPSPYSVDQGFAGSGVFAAASAFCQENYFDLRKYIYGNNQFLEDLVTFGKNKNVVLDKEKAKKMPLYILLNEVDIPVKTNIDWCTS